MCFLECCEKRLLHTMSDHQNYCNNFLDENSIDTQDIEASADDSQSIIDAEKSGDDLLIELYRERQYLYDKKHQNYKDTLMKQNAWIEISKIMIETNCGNV